MKAYLRKEITDYKAWVLDMDGTLYYQLPVRICMAFELLFYYLFRPNKISDLVSVYKYRKKNEKGELQKQDVNITVWMQKKPKKYVRFFRDRKLIKQAQTMQRRGVKTVVYSDYPLTEKLEALSPFQPDFAFSAGDAEIQCLKPDNKGLLHIVKVLNLPVEDIVFIGDRLEKDAACAQKTGMDYLVLNRIFFIRNKIYKKMVKSVFGGRISDT